MKAPRDFEQLLSIPGVGPKTLRALALVAELIYGPLASTRDPARFAFAHGGKDRIPYPVRRSKYLRTDHHGPAAGRTASQGATFRQSQGVETPGGLQIFFGREQGGRVLMHVKNKDSAA
jgi:hypothetical protein